MKTEDELRAFVARFVLTFLTAIALLIACAPAQAVQPQVAAGTFYTVGLRSDGTVVATGAGWDELNVGSWSDVVQVAAGMFHTVGLRSDGSVVAVGKNESGELNVSSWRDIIQVAASDGNTLGLRSNGTVAAVGNDDDGELDVDSWRNIVQLAAAGSLTVGLKSDGTVVAAGDNEHGQANVNSWRDIVQVATSGSHTVGLRSDGRVVAVGFNYDGELDVGSWEDIVQVAAGVNHTVGLKSDGTVVAAGDNHSGQCLVSDWDLDGGAVPALSEEVAITAINLSPADHLQAGAPVTVTANAAGAAGQTIYYKFYYCANYGTNDYLTTPWTVVQDYSTDNSAEYIFPSAGNYIVVVRAVTDPDHEPVSLPIIGQAVVVGDDSQVSLAGMTVNAATTTNAGDPVTVTATAVGPEGRNLYYQFYYCANYGTPSYANTRWTLVQPYSASNTCQYTFPADGNYIIVVRAVTDPDNEPPALPIVGSAITIGDPVTPGE